MQPKRGAILALGIPVGIVVALLITSVIAWIYLGLPSAKFDIFKMPGVFWYYRNDLVVMKAFAGGALVGLSVAGLIWWRVAKGKPPHHRYPRLPNTSNRKQVGWG